MGYLSIFLITKENTHRKVLDPTVACKSLSGWKNPIILCNFSVMNISILKKGFSCGFSSVGGGGIASIPVNS